MAQSVLFNFGALGTLDGPSLYRIRYIREEDAELNQQGVHIHHDPDLAGWIFGDYPLKPVKGKLGELVPGDYLFFSSSLRSGRVRMQYLVAAMQIQAVDLLPALIHRFLPGLPIPPPYATHPHVQRYFFGAGEDPFCTFFRGNPRGSFVVRDPVPIDRDFIRQIYALFHAERHQNSPHFNWYYNDPDFPIAFGNARNKHGKVFSDTTLIGSKFRSPPLMPAEITAWILDRLQRRPILDPRDYASHGILYGPVLG